MDLPADAETFFAELARRAERGELTAKKPVLSGIEAAAYGRQVIATASADLGTDRDR